MIIPSQRKGLKHTKERCETYPNLIGRAMNWVLHQFSHFTSTLLTVVASLPYPLLAVHLYDPESSLCTSVRRNWWKALLERLIGTPSLVQVIFGWGSPEALHVSVKSFPTSTCTLSIGALVILGGADNEGSKSKMNTNIYSLSKCTQEYQNTGRIFFSKS